MRTLHEAGKLEFREVPGAHMHFNLEWCAFQHGQAVIPFFAACIAVWLLHDHTV